MATTLTMTESTTSYALGTPVEIGRIERELKRLWAEGEGAITRASLINLAVYSEKPDSLSRNTQLISQLTEHHACRAIVVGANPAAAASRTEAWISAHCHVRGGAKQMCSEQISFLLEGAAVSLLPSIVFSQLDSDLPLYLWWQSAFPETLDPQLWTWVDRLIYDSGEWPDFEAQIRRVEIAQREATQRIVLCDLNWTRLDRVRLAFAQFFDHPASHHHFDEIEQVSVDYGDRSTALLFIGWLAAQLDWELVPGKDSIAFKNRVGKTVAIRLQKTGDVPISLVVARSCGVDFRVSRATCGDRLEVCRGKSDESHRYQLMPASEDDLVNLVSEELMRGGPHQIYLRAVAKVRALL